MKIFHRRPSPVRICLNSPPCRISHMLSRFAEGGIPTAVCSAALSSGEPAAQSLPDSPPGGSERSTSGCGSSRSRAQAPSPDKVPERRISGQQRLSPAPIREIDTPFRKEPIRSWVSCQQQCDAMLPAASRDLMAETRTEGRGGSGADRVDQTGRRQSSRNPLRDPPQQGDPHRG
jgi:hypothetical protein